ncbi:MAG: sigma-70 family RNA polymerase sigma factor [Thermoguttaceae bacterium]|jgi:RNA polymerase sigma-70 factor (ECF subfamily)|nr:sigma-70 family RNA polymerase sigma factor [Thermoguttaceae bacterium]
MSSDVACSDGSPRPADQPKVERFAKLLATCQRRVFLYVLGLLHNATDAEEVLQETNLVLWRKFDQYQPGTSFDRWACRIAQYEAFKFRQKKARGERLFSNEFVERLAHQTERDWESLDARRAALVECLGKLSEKDRQLVIERYRERATTRRVATALGRSIQGTRRSLHRIRMALLACMERTLAVEERA